MLIQLAFILFTTSIANSQTSANEYETVVEDVIFNSSSKVVIDEKTIKESKAPDLISLITTQANVTLFNNNFQPPQLFMRGAESSHVLIIVDGVPVYDVSWAQRTLNLNSLNISNVKRIEIIKGGQTVLHGGQALAGVIKIETFAAQFQNERKVMVTTGLTEAQDNRLGLGVETAFGENAGLKVSGRLMEKKNQSPVLDSSKLYDQRNQNLDLSFEKRGAVTLRTRGFYFNDKSWNPTTVNISGSQSIADSDVQRQDEQHGASAQLTLNEVPTKPRLAVYGQSGWRRFYSGPESANVNAKFKSQLQGAMLDITPFENTMVKLNSGISYLKENFFLSDELGTLGFNSNRTNVFSEARGAYVMAQVSPIKDNVLIETGARIEKVTGYTEQNSYQIGLTLFKKTKLEWVTGYRAPSLAQRFGIFPNAALKPETSQTYSLTQEENFSDWGKISGTLFETSFSNYIEPQSPPPTFVTRYVNAANVKTRGIELASSLLLGTKHNLQMSYAYQEPWNQERHEQLRRRPRVSGSIRIFQHEEKSTWMLEGTGVGQRGDYFGNRRYKFPGYFLTNASVTYNMMEKMNLALRISNILDYRPEYSIDYYGEGRNAWLTWDYAF